MGSCRSADTWISVGGGTTDADINVFGPMARSAEDLDLLLDVMAGPDADRSVGVAARPSGRDDRLPVWRSRGVWFDEADYPIDRGYRAVLGRTADALAERVLRWRPPDRRSRWPSR